MTRLDSQFLNQVKQTSGTAIGTQVVATTATMNLEGDDLYGFTISDGTQSYTLQPTVVDISNTTSTGKFVEDRRCIARFKHQNLNGY